MNVIPRDNTFFMKPLVRELAAALTRRRKGEPSDTERSDLSITQSGPLT